MQTENTVITRKKAIYKFYDTKKKIKTVVSILRDTESFIKDLDVV